MKELSIEEKAKAYDEAIKRAKTLYDNNQPISGSNVIINNIFPELKESGDERIRKMLIKFFGNGAFYDSYTNGISDRDIVAWLEKQKAVDILDEEEREFADNIDSYRKEVDAAYQKGYNEGVKTTLEKQGEQKSIDYNEELKKCRENPLYFFDKYVKLKLKDQTPAWSEEDSTYYDDICEILINLIHSETTKINKNAVQKDLDWLKSLKDRVGCEANWTTVKEWNVEDISKVQRICRYLDGSKKYYADITEIRECIDWLKSLKPQKRWKPSDEQMNDLKIAIDSFTFEKDYLQELYEDLKKLREE